MVGENGAPATPDWRYTAPLAGPMPARRAIADGCRSCRLSEVACDASWYVTKEACCEDCGHP